MTNENTARISYASFIVPHDDVEVEPFDHMSDGGRSCTRMYKKVKFGDYQRQSMKRKMEGKAHADFAKIET